MIQWIFIIFFAINCDHRVVLLAQSIIKGPNKQGMMNGNGVQNNIFDYNKVMSRQIHHSSARSHRPEISRADERINKHQKLNHHTLNNFHEGIKRRLAYDLKSDSIISNHYENEKYHPYKINHNPHHKGLDMSNYIHYMTNSISTTAASNVRTDIASDHTDNNKKIKENSSQKLPLLSEIYQDKFVSLKDVGFFSKKTHNNNKLTQITHLNEFLQEETLEEFMDMIGDDGLKTLSNAMSGTGDNSLSGGGLVSGGGPYNSLSGGGLVSGGGPTGGANIPPDTSTPTNQPISHPTDQPSTNSVRQRDPQPQT